jgi:hydrogenase maturation protein HypF
MGWVNNSAQGVAIEIEGNCIALNLFLLRLEQEKPPRSRIQSLNTTILDPVGYSDFTIRESTSGKKTAIVLPDIALKNLDGLLWDYSTNTFGKRYLNCDR